MTRAIHIGYVLGLSLIGIGAGPSYATCTDKLDSQLCDLLGHFNDTDWVGCMVGLKLQPPDQNTDPTKDTTTHHDTASYSPPPYLIAEVDSLFSNYELRWPDTISQYRLAPYPTKNRASVPTPAEADYGVFIRKRDVISLGAKEYIGGIWAWMPAVPAVVTPFLHEDMESRYQGNIFNLNGQRINDSKFLTGPFLKFR